MVIFLGKGAIYIEINKQEIFWKYLGGVADGARTHDNRNHNPGLYQLSYSHHQESIYYLIYTNYIWTIAKLINNGVPDRDRTCNPQLRRLVLYPIELRAQSSRAYPN